MSGNTFYSAKLEAYATTIPMAQLAPGQYIISLEDAATGEKKNITILKRP
jgi:hypothetical protein